MNATIGALLVIGGAALIFWTLRGTSSSTPAGGSSGSAGMK